MESADFHLHSAGLNPKAITIWRSFGDICATSWAVLGSGDPALGWELTGGRGGVGLPGNTAAHGDRSCTLRRSTQPGGGIAPPVTSPEG